MATTRPTACGSHCPCRRRTWPHGPEPRGRRWRVRCTFSASWGGSRHGGARSRSSTWRRCGPSSNRSTGECARLHPRPVVGCVVRLPARPYRPPCSHRQQEDEMVTAQHPHIFEARISRTTVVVLALTVAVATLAVIAAGRLSAPTTAASAPAQPLPLTDRVLVPSKARGFIRTASPSAVRPTGQRQRLGFIAGVNEQLHGVYPVKAEAVSIVEHFRSAEAARA